MRRSEHRILVSHAGNLPRPDYLDELVRGDRRHSLGADYTSRLPMAVNEIAQRQVELGVDIVNDGEYAKAGSYGGYHARPRHRLLAGADLIPTSPAEARRPGERDRREFPGFFTSGLWFQAPAVRSVPDFTTPGEVRIRTNLRGRVCTGPIT